MFPSGCRSRAAFTLLELSIVLTIIALAVGSAIIGKDLIRAAQVRKQITQLEQYNSSVNGFRNKYSCIPGDCKAASGFGLGTDGDGNGNVDFDDMPNSFNSSEVRGFWQHLSNASLIEYGYVAGSVPGINSPPLAMPGNGLEGNASGGVWLIPYGAGSAPLDVIYAFQCSGGTAVWAPPAWLLTTTTDDDKVAGPYLPADMYAIDAKIDDGFPLRGLVMVGSNTLVLAYDAGSQTCNTLSYSTDSSPDACIDVTNTEPVYNLSRGTAPSVNSLCYGIVKANF